MKRLWIRIADFAISRVNRLEQDDPTLSWRPWSLNRGKADPRI